MGFVLITPMLVSLLSVPCEHCATCLAVNVASNTTKKLAHKQEIT